MKVICTQIGNFKGKSITVGKIYDVISIDADGDVEIIDDEGERDFLWLHPIREYQLISEPKTDPIVERVLNRFINRSSVGIKKYGTTLYENEKDDFLTHLQEELMDAVLYIEKLKQQRDEQSH